MSSPEGSACESPSVPSGDDPPNLEEDPVCGGISEVGICEESGTATWCEPGDGVWEWRCAEYGLRCEVTDDQGATCVGEASPECEQLGYEGECAGNVARYCENDVLIERNCSDLGLTCQQNVCFEGADCCEVQDEQDVSECERLGLEGECSGNVVRYCLEGEITQQDCSETGTTCEVDVCGEGAFCCEEGSSSDECGDVGSEGRCVNDATLEYCSSGSLVEETCEAGTTCVEDLCTAGEARCCNNAILCDLLPEEGVCGGPDGKTAIICIGGTPYVQDCGTEPCTIDSYMGAICGEGW